MSRGPSPSTFLLLPGYFPEHYPITITRTKGQQKPAKAESFAYHSSAARLITFNMWGVQREGLILLYRCSRRTQVLMSHITDIAILHIIPSL